MRRVGCRVWTLALCRRPRLQSLWDLCSTVGSICQWRRPACSTTTLKLLALAPASNGSVRPDSIFLGEAKKKVHFSDSRGGSWSNVRQICASGLFCYLYLSVSLEQSCRTVIARRCLPGIEETISLLSRSSMRRARDLFRMASEVVRDGCLGKLSLPCPFLIVMPSRSPC